MPLYRATAAGPVELTPDEEAALRAEWAANAAAIRIPQVVTMRQARLALSQSGLLASVNAAVQAADEVTQLTWEYSQELKRTDPYVIALGAAIGLTSEQIDQLFIEAAIL